METHVVSPQGREVIIGENYPTVLIGERINPFGKGTIREGMMSNNMEPIREEARRQVKAGADILVVSAGAFGIDETVVLPQVTEAVMKAIDVPGCLESRNLIALEKTLNIGCGRPIISSATGDEALLNGLLPLVRRYDTALIVLPSDESGIPNNAERRLGIITSVFMKAQQEGIRAEDLLADCIAESIAVNGNAALTTLETMGMVSVPLD
ncbi:MAG: 5-methyltetrahydrofolate:corrinoid/iron-sulfur protein co-methyltransferase [Syntrophorhabdus sp. PtaU1.Bin058]|nr:MAG: 5-methyltetrahydrofolate:corrinoid/iron-sulfur protein co-methyltransferase [Syntrophorhabdus sp. PtaU1.Bin058]